MLVCGVLFVAEYFASFMIRSSKEKEQDDVEMIDVDDSDTNDQDDEDATITQDDDTTTTTSDKPSPSKKQKKTASDDTNMDPSVVRNMFLYFETNNIDISTLDVDSVTMATAIETASMHTDDVTMTM